MRACLSLFILCLLTITATISAEGWNQFRGASGNGKTPADLPLEFSESDGVAWKVPLAGKAWSSPVIWKKQIWVTNALPDGHKLWALCFDLETGKKIHDILVFDVAEPQFCIAKNSYASPTPVIEEGRIFVSFGAHGNACIDTATGKTIWERRDLQCNHHRSPASSPVPYGDLYILHFDGFDKQYVVALDKETGKTRWTHQRAFNFRTDNGDRKKAYGTPAVITHKGLTQLISPAAVATESLDPLTGKLLWTAYTGGMNASARPIYGHGLVFITNGMGQMSAVRPEGKGKLAGKNIAWASKRGVPKKSSLILDGKLLFMVSDLGVASCVDAETGKAHWTDRLGGNYAASPIFARGRIYFFNEDGEIPVIEAGKKFKLLARNKLADGFMASPAISGNSLILRTKSNLYRIGK
jgi:outer membrane protein assembly factor BamB